jgi:glucose/arabinose dehydrogenase
MGAVSRAMRTALLLAAVASLLPVVSEAGTAALEYEVRVAEVDGAQREVRLPKGYVLDVLTTDLVQPRSLVFAPNGDLIVGSIEGAIYRLEPPYTSPQVLVRLDDIPHGVALRDGEILIGRTHGLHRAPYQPGQVSIDESDVTLLAKLPSEGPHHKTRTVAVGPDGRVYVSLGMTGNCGDNYIGDGYPFESRRGGFLVLREGDGPPRLEPYATGLRNPVGFDWHPETKVLYSSNNGPDHWGFELPPEYLARVTEGSFHGMPWFQFDGTSLKRDECVKSRPPRPMSEVELPVATFPAHQAPVALAFVPDGALDPDLTGDAIVALHGSWASTGTAADRRKPKLVVVRFALGEAQRVDDLVTGFQLDSGKRWVRPAGLAFGPDHALYFSSDRKPGALFRLRRAD